MNNLISEQLRWKVCVHNYLSKCTTLQLYLLYSALSAKRLEHELTLESLSYEQARWKLKAENQEWIKEKLTKKLQLTDIKLDTAKLELELLKRQYDLNHSKSEEVVNKE